MRDANFLVENNAKPIWHPMAHPAEMRGNPPKVIMKGEGTEADPTRAIGLYEEAAAGGLTGPASLALGLYFRTHDEAAKARAALQTAAAAGESEAKLALGEMLEEAGVRVLAFAFAVERAWAGGRERLEAGGHRVVAAAAVLAVEDGRPVLA